jgi:hypothetical protein
MSLIPTPRTDKNGITSIRHMKPEMTPSVPVKHLPAVTLPAAPEEPVELTDEQLIDLIDPERLIPEGVDTYLDLLREDDPETLPYISKLLTTGSERGREEILEVFRNQLNRLANHYTYDGDDWRVRSEDIRSPFLEGELNLRWVLANLADELPGYRDEIPGGGTLGSIMNIHHSHAGYHNRSHQAMEPEYWRGIAAIHLSGLPYRAKDNTDKFIWWAGRHDNLGAVIQLASERRTLDVDTLSGVLAQYDPKSPIRDGFL